jgi:LemA protein
MKHEKDLLEGISRARAGLVSGNPAQAAAADQQVSQGLRQVWAVAESYPDLKSNANFGKLQDELSATENGIAHARQGYNESALNYNNKVQMVPSNIVANMFGMRPVDYFRAAEAEREVVKVKF